MENPTKQIAPKRQTKRVENFTMRDKLAVMALHVPGLVIGDERNGTTDEILALFQIDHIVPCVFGGTRAPQNGRPLRTAEHKGKSAGEKRMACKTARISGVHRDWWQRVMAKSGQGIESEEPKQRKSRKIPSRQFPKKWLKS